MSIEHIFRSWYTSALFYIYLCYFDVLLELVLYSYLLQLVTSYYQGVFHHMLDNRRLKTIKLRKRYTYIPIYFLLICPDPHIGRKLSPLNILFYYTTVKLRLKLILDLILDLLSFFPHE